MKFFAIFAAVVALSAASNSPVATWTLQEIEAALNDPATDQAQIPYLINGLNTLMEQLFAGSTGTTSIVLALPVQESMTLDQLAAAVHDPATHPALLPYYEEALNQLMVALMNGQEASSIALNIPNMNVNIWTLPQLTAAIENPETDPELLIYLEHALNQHMNDLFAGNQPGPIAVVTPPGVIAIVPELIPTPVIPEAITEPEQPEPVQPEPVQPAPASSSSPLVQIIVNVNANQQAVSPTPVAVVDPIGVSPVQETPVGPVLAVGPWA